MGQRKQGGPNEVLMLIAHITHKQGLQIHVAAQLFGAVCQLMLVVGSSVMASDVGQSKRQLQLK